MSRSHLMTWGFGIVGWAAVALAADSQATRPGAGRVGLVGEAGIEFSLVAGRLHLVSLRGGRGMEWVVASSGKASLWGLALRGPGGAAAELESDALSAPEAKGDGSGVGFRWKARVGEGEVQVSLTASSSGHDGLSSWRLGAVLPDGWSVVRADWPILAHLRTGSGLKMAAPFGWGLEYEVKPGMGYEATYPSLVASMPFVAFYGGGEGLYVGMHDPKGNHKHLAVKAREDGVGVTFTHWAAASDTVSGRYAPGFEAVIGVFDGDYWDAAQIYRAFTYQTPWGGACHGLKLSDPKRAVPAWLKDIELWLMPGPEPLKNVDMCRKAAEFFGVPIALHWYNWHEIPFDTLYPEYFPAKPDFREGVKALQGAGLRVMPYINGRLCDRNSKTWVQEGGDKAAARQENGQPYTEVYGSKVPLNVMCPATVQWQNKIAGIVDRLFSECGVDGVYIDQIGAAGAVRCFDAGHGHSVGGGTFWFDGYRKMLDRIRARMPEDRMLTTEENAECWNDQLDALLMVNTPAVGGRRVIPLMPTVYGGRVITFGFQYMHGSDIPKSLPFRAKMVRDFLWGAQLGWLGVEGIMADGARKEAEFLRNLAKARRGGHEFLLEGQFLGEVEVIGDQPRLKGAGSAGGGEYAIDLPVVMATAWLAADGTMGLAVANISDEPRAVELRPPWGRLRLARAWCGEGVEAAGEGSKTIPVSVPAGGACVVRAR
ncbi:MAG: hypothetical protein KA354_06875 [Phycisphaerae bacterium]|nr:hypothetical protein [Phycisphaerae bacterium]